MADIQHRDIPDGERHEPKGIATATSGQIYIADGATSGTWTTPTTVVVYTASLSPVACAANTTAEQALTFTGVETSDYLLNVVKPTAQAGLGIVGARISAADTVAITFSNNTGAPITPTAAETYTVYVWK